MVFIILSPNVMLFGYAIFDEYVVTLLLLAFFLARIIKT